MLVKYLLQTTGDVIELGSGNYSTPILHEITAHQGRRLETIDNNKDWLKLFKHFESSLHTIQFIRRWNRFQPTKQYGLAFVDHADPPTHPRWLQVEKLLPLAQTIIIHDTEDPLYGYDKIMDRVDVIDSCTQYKTHTLVLRPKSND
jgi:hypothetical protein